jgi:predicted nucleic acid-binding protein
VIVLDASAVVELLLNTAGGRRVATRIADPEVTLHAPHLLAAEVIQVLRRYVADGSIAAAVAEAALQDLVELGVALYGHEPFLPRVWELRSNVTAYDGLYVALAEVLDAPLVTFDRRLARAPGSRAVVELLG